MTDQEKNRQVAKISIFITSIFVIFLSISYAFINQTLTGTKRQVITSGNLELELKEGEAITLENALPMYDEVGMIQDPFTFSVTNKTDKGTNYTLKLVDITPKGTQKLGTSVVKYGLEKDGIKTIDSLSNLTDGVLDTGTISGNGTIHYTLRFWIKSNIEYEGLIKDESLSYKIEIVAQQEINYKGMLKERTVSKEWRWGDFVDVPEESDYYEKQYSNNITNILIENKMSIPSDVEDNHKWDMSYQNDGSVMAYLEENEISESENTTYTLHLQSNGKIVANQNSAALFYGFTNLESINGFEYLDISNVQKFGTLSEDSVEGVTIFGGCPKLNLDLRDLDTSKVKNMSYMFYNYSSSEPLNLSNFNTSNATDMSYMFSDYSSSAPLDLSSFDTSKVTNMSGMFSRYSSSQPLDLSNFNTSNVTDMSWMFKEYSSSEPLDLSSFNTSNVTDMSHMFNFCRSSEFLNLSNLDTSKVTDMSGMFSGYSSSQPLDLSNFNTSNVTDMSGMFSGYSSSQPLDLSNFNTSKVTNMSGMFSGYSSSQSLDLSNFNTSNVTNMTYMFSSYSGSQPLDLSNFNTSNVTNMTYMFHGYSSSASLDISGFDVSKVTSIYHMFSRDSVYYYGSPILVKDEAMKAWVLEQDSDLTNVTVKGA